MSEPLQTPKARVFISYSRRDLAQIDALQDGLRAREVEAYVDRTDIAKGEDWWRRIEQLIAEADVIVFALSPASLASEICGREAEHAETLGKRLLPILLQPVDFAAVPPALSRRNAIYFHENAAVGADGDFDRALNELEAAIETDLDWVREHTRLLTRALVWRERGEPRDGLLRGVELERAEAWSASRPAAAPPPNDLHAAFLAESRRRAVRRARGVIALSLAAAAIGLGLAAAAGAQWLRAEEELRRATALRLAADARAVLSEAQKESEFIFVDADRAALLALEAQRIEPTTAGDRALRESVVALQFAAASLPTPDFAGYTPVGILEDVVVVAAGEGAFLAQRYGPLTEEEQAAYEGAETGPPKAWRAATPEESASASVLASQAGVQDRTDANILAKSADESLQAVLLDPEDFGEGEPSFGDRIQVRRRDGVVIAVVQLDWRAAHVRFSRDNAYVMTLTARGSLGFSEGSAVIPGSRLRVFALPSGRMVADHSYATAGGITGAAFDASGERMALSFSHENRIIVAPIWPETLEEEACRRLTRNMSENEWAELVGDRPYRVSCPGVWIPEE